MTEKLPRITDVSVAAPMTLAIHWRDEKQVDRVDLTGWVATGGKTLVLLFETKVFEKAHVENYGAAVAWDDGDLAIDAFHLKQLADEQKPFRSEELRLWQELTKLSNNEAADLVGVSLSAWTGYRSGSTVPTPVAMLCRAIVRDPILMQAHFRPRTAGRPKKAATS